MASQVDYTLSGDMSTLLREQAELDVLIDELSILPKALKRRSLMNLALTYVAFRMMHTRFSALACRDWFDHFASQAKMMGFNVSDVDLFVETISPWIYTSEVV